MPEKYSPQVVHPSDRRFETLVVISSHRIHLPLVLFQINVLDALFQSFVTQFLRFYRPIVEIVAGHRALGQASMVLLVGALVDRPDRVVPDFGLKTDGRADVAAGFLDLARRDVGAIFIGQPRFLEEEFSA